MLTLDKIAELTATEYRGDGSTPVSKVSSIVSADQQSICFALSKHYLSQALATSAGVIIVTPDLADEHLGRPLLLAHNPEYTFTQVIHLLQDAPVIPAVHTSAIIDESVVFNETHTIGAQVVIGKNVVLGDGVHIGAGCVIEDDVVIGEHSYLHSRVVVCHHSIIGKHVILHSGAVIGSDGFGLTRYDKKWVKIPQIGRVILEDEVEVGANTTIDRGALDDTVIRRGVKLDNQIQIAHNVEIGENTAMAACVGVAGSAKIGKNCQISGAAVVLGHLTIADDVVVTAMSLVTKSIKQAGVYSSGTPLLDNKQWHKNNVRYKQLDDLAKAVKNLEKRN